MKLQAKMLGATLGLLLLAGTPAAFAQGPDRHFAERGMRGPGGRDGMQRLFDFLGLDDQQREDWKNVQKSHFEALRPTFEQMRDLREQLRAELESGAPDATKVGQLVIDTHNLEAGLKASHQDLETALRAILTPEQQTKYDAWKAANPGPPHGFGPGGPGGPHRGGPGQGPGTPPGA